MRITGGRARSISIDCPKGDWVRPATDRMREAVFSAIAGDVAGAVFLDLFAGAGSYGLEAMSRGASEGVFVEQHRQAVQSITRNIKKVEKSLGVDSGDGGFSVQSSDVFQWLSRSASVSGQGQFDLIFVDPPYDQVEASFQRILEQLIPFYNPEKGAWILFESPVSIDSFPAGYRLKKTFGKGREDTRAMLLSWLPRR